MTASINFFKKNWDLLHAKLNYYYYNCLEKPKGKKVAINSILKDIWIIGKRKALCRQIIQGSRSGRKETVDINILSAYRRR